MMALFRQTHGQFCKEGRLSYAVLLAEVVAQLLDVVRPPGLGDDCEGWRGLVDIGQVCSRCFEASKEDAQGAVTYT